MALIRLTLNLQDYFSPFWSRAYRNVNSIPPPTIFQWLLLLSPQRSWLGFSNCCVYNCHWYLIISTLANDSTPACSIHDNDNWEDKPQIAFTFQQGLKCARPALGSVDNWVTKQRISGGQLGGSVRAVRGRWRPHAHPISDLPLLSLICRPQKQTRREKSETQTWCAAALCNEWSALAEMFMSPATDKQGRSVSAGDRDWVWDWD